LAAVLELSEVRNILAERVMEWTQEWKQQGVAEGIKEGIKKGIKKVAREANCCCYRDY
jgi:flagellar biosynthesis/type III secretory pathway protein FliH